MTYTHTCGFALQSTGPGTARPSSSKSPPPPHAASIARISRAAANLVRLLMPCMVRQKSKKSNTRRDDSMTKQTVAVE